MQPVSWEENTNDRYSLQRCGNILADWFSVHAVARRDAGSGICSGDHHGVCNQVQAQISKNFLKEDLEMQILAGGFFQSLKYAIGRFVTWAMKEEKPCCPKSGCAGRETVSTGNVRFSPPSPLMNAGVDLWPTLNVPFIMREYKCEGCGDTFWD